MSVPAIRAQAPAPARLSKPLAAAIETPRVWFDTDHGAEFRDGLWRPPQVVPPALRAEATALLPAAIKAAECADRRTVEDWLDGLGVLVAGRISAEDASVKVAAYASLLDHPACCFTRDTLARAGRRFKWLPSFAELAEFLDREARPARDMAYRLDKLAAAPGPSDAKPPPAPLTDAEAKFQALKEQLKANPADLPKPERRSHGPAQWSDAVKDVINQEQRRRAAESEKQDGAQP